MKLLLVVVGLVCGAAGSTSWLLSKPVETRALPLSEDLKARWAEVRARFADALSEGRIQGTETEERLRLELDAYRTGRRP
jgi:hypothetical protein